MSKFLLSDDDHILGIYTVVQKTGPLLYFQMNSTNIGQCQ